MKVMRPPDETMPERVIVLISIFDRSIALKILYLRQKSPVTYFCKQLFLLRFSTVDLA